RKLLFVFYVESEFKPFGNPLYESEVAGFGITCSSCWESRTILDEKPCRREFCEDLAFPSNVLGPVLLLAFF
ncbi:hypothetical protein RYZ26_18700, partial [Terasakiella sp. A23]|uniref:hypothetical protein n=1 Tax=Terasakiella sp. FCG-A23 TaxID=3080561 RepID=UPI002953CB1A